MSTKSRWWILGGALGLYLIGLGFVGGIAADRIRFDRQRTAVLTRYDEAVRQWHTYLMQLELTPTGEREASAAPWTVHLRRVDEALAQKNVMRSGVAGESGHEKPRRRHNDE